MVTTARRRQDVLDELRGADTREGYSSRFRKEDLLDLLNFFDEGGSIPGTRAEIRQKIREVTSLCPDKEGKPFRKRELLTLGREIERRRWLAPAKVRTALEKARDEDAEVLIVNGTDFEIQGFNEEHDCESPAYEGFILAELSQQHRVVAAYDWVEDKCMYRNGAALEQRKGSPPYYRWKRREYVTSIDWETTGTEEVTPQAPIPRN